MNSLHSTIAKHAVHQASSYRQSYLNHAIPFNRAPAVTLWEGNPPLPVQPSPASLRSLHELRKAMQTLGADIWTSGTNDAVKHEFGNVICSSIEMLVLGAPNGHQDEPPNQSRDDKEPPKLSTNGDLSLIHI